MSLSLHDMMNEAREELYRRSKLREQLESLKREVIRASKQAVLYVHRGEMRKAAARLRKAKATVERVLEVGKGHPDLVYTGSFDAACQEYAEARLLMDFLSRGRYPKWGEIGVSPVPYVMALGDLVGELRRSSLDRLKEGKVEEAERHLKAMEDLYLELLSIDEPRAISGDLRHKVDVARHLVEATRGELAIEFRRKSLEGSIRSLEEAIRRLGPSPGGSGGSSKGGGT